MAILNSLSYLNHIYSTESTIAVCIVSILIVFCWSYKTYLKQSASHRHIWQYMVLVIAFLLLVGSSAVSIDTFYKDNHINKIQRIHHKQNRSRIFIKEEPYYYHRKLINYKSYNRFDLEGHRVKASYYFARYSYDKRILSHFYHYVHKYYPKK